MGGKANGTILVINAGSSSVKIALYGQAEEKLFAARVEPDGKGNVSVQNTFGPTWGMQTIKWDDTVGLTNSLRQYLSDNNFKLPVVIGHRIVHGGRDFVDPVRLTVDVIEQIERLTALAPEHLPFELALIKAFAISFSESPQIGCFDTAFHRPMPILSRMFPLPRKYFDEGIERFGFHGLSYEYLCGELRKENEPAIKKGKVILAHLGNGSSLAAVLDGKPVDTTMGFTPAGGCMMGTRSGDLDPGLFRYLSQEKGMSAEAFDHMINHESGLKGVSGISSDIRELTKQANENTEQANENTEQANENTAHANGATEQADQNAAQAIELYCLQVKKSIGALAAHLGGVDLLVFAGGIGENSAAVRQKICAHLDFLGVRLEVVRADQESDAKASVSISSNESRIRVLVRKTDEEKMIAEHCRKLLAATL